jgi:hypothetical protein
MEGYDTTPRDERQGESEITVRMKSYGGDVGVMAMGDGGMAECERHGCVWEARTDGGSITKRRYYGIIHKP